MCYMLGAWVLFVVFIMCMSVLPLCMVYICSLQSYLVPGGSEVGARSSPRTGVTDGWEPRVVAGD